MKKSVKALPFAILLAILGLFLGMPTAQAFTEGSGIINVDTTWTAANSPYHVSGVLVNAGATLTIEPGVVVKLSDNATIDVNGTLNVSGAPSDKVYFTSLKDDTLGGDSNADGAGTTPASGDWRNIKFFTGSTGNISNAVVKYAGAVFFSGSGGIFNNGGDVVVDGTFFEENGIGILNLSGNLNVTGSEFSNQGIGIYAWNGSASVSGSTFHDHTQSGLFMHPQSNLTSLTMTDNTFSNNAVAVSLMAFVSNFTHSGNTSSGIGLNGFEIGGSISSDRTWSKDAMPYVVGGIQINAGATLTIDPGVVVKLEDARYFDIYGTLNAVGTAEEKIYFTSWKDDTVGGDANGDGSATLPAPRDWRNLKFNSGAGTLSNIVLRYAGTLTFLGNVGIYNNGGNLAISESVITDNGDEGLFQPSGSTVITSSEFSNHAHGIYRLGGSVDISNSNIKNNSQFGILNNGSGNINAINNFWGDATGPYHSTQNTSGLGNAVSDRVDFTPWLGAYPPVPTGCVVDCYSNVLFLPGIMGSRLYETTDMEHPLWVSAVDVKQAELALDANGKSINDVYTKNDTQRLDGDTDETGIVDDIFSLNIYQSFINDLKKWKQNDKIIEDYAFIPYDWRLSLDDIINNGSASLDGKLSYTQPQDFSQSFIFKKLEKLQQSSRSGKVTIIGHSNGGLVAKALIQKLKDTNNPLYDKIDKVIFVAVPQVGTPDAIVGLLHGADLGPGGVIMENERSRQLSENMSTVYNLLPSSGYFSTVDPAFAIDKLVSFENTPYFTPQTSQYGVFVSSATELKNYILGIDGRTKPSFNDTVHPNIGNAYLYNQAESIHQMLDSWQPSSNTKVIQIAGWGEETLAGLDYKTYLGFNGVPYLSFTPRKVVDGDGTVVVPSALWMSTNNSNVERWWVDLKRYDTLSNLKRIHKDILEVSNLRNFINSQLRNSVEEDADKIIVSNNSTLTSSDTRLHYTLHSPLTLGVVDSQGRYTGLDPLTKEIKEEIPGVVYKRIGEVQFISAPDDLSYTVKMQGYKQGNFSLDVEKQEGNTILETTSFQGLPSFVSTLATMDVFPDFQISTSVLEIDQNGDSVVDKTLSATLNGITTYDITPPELQVTFDILNKDVVLSAQDAVDLNSNILVTKNSATLKDIAGNTTIIPLIKYKDKKTEVKLAFDKIIRNGVPTLLPNTRIEYEWNEKKGILVDLDTKVIVRGEEKYTFSYKKEKDVTIIKEKRGKSTVTTTKMGLVVVTINTEGNILKINY